MSIWVHRYTAAAAGLFANAFLVESEEGVVAVDSPLLLNDGAAFRARLEALNKPLAGVLLTHSHPDHYNTVHQVIAGEDVPVIALDEVDRVIREHDDAKRAQWGDMFGDQWPPSTTFPTDTVRGDETVTLAGMRFTARSYGRGECASQTVWLLEDGAAGAFIGDLVFNGTHSYLGEGATEAWIKMLERTSTDLASVPTLYCGHGDPGGASLLTEQKRYLLMVREAIKRLAGTGGALSDAARQELSRLMDAFLPGAPLLWLVAATADAVATEIATMRDS